MPDDRPNLPDDTPTRSVRGYFDQPFIPPPGQIFSTPTISQKIAGYSPDWPTPPHQRLEGSDTIGQLYGDDGDPLQPFMWVGVTAAEWMPGLTDLTQAEIDDLGTLPVITDDAVPPVSVERIRISFDEEFLGGDHYIPMKANDRLYALPINGKITPTLPAYVIEYDWPDVVGFTFTDETRTRWNAVMSALSSGDLLLARDPDDLGKIYSIGGRQSAINSGGARLWMGLGGAGWEMGARVWDRLRWSLFSNRSFLTHEMVEPADDGTAPNYLEHGLGTWDWTTSPLYLLYGLMQSSALNTEETTQALQPLQEEATGLRDYDEGRWEYLLYPHFCPAGGRVNGLSYTNALYDLAEKFGNWNGQFGEDLSGDPDAGYEYVQVDLVFYRPQYGPNPVVQVTYPPAPPQTYELRVDLTPPPEFTATGPGEYEFGLGIDNIDAQYSVGEVYVWDDDVADVSAIDISAVVDDMVAAFNDEFDFEDFTMTRQPDDNGQAVLVIESDLPNDEQFLFEIYGQFYVRSNTEARWDPVNWFSDEVPVPEQPDPIYDDPTTWGWFADISEDPAHVITGQPKLDWIHEDWATIADPVDQFNLDHSIVQWSHNWGVNRSILEDIYRDQQPGWRFRGDVPPGPWICMLRIRYLKVMETTTVIVVSRRTLRDGTRVTVEEEVEVPASYSDQGYVWEEMDNAGLNFHYAIRSEDLPTGPVATKVISPWAQLLPDDTILPGWVDKDNIIQINNWLDP